MTSGSARATIASTTTTHATAASITPDGSARSEKYQPIPKARQTGTQQNRCPRWRSITALNWFQRPMLAPADRTG